METVLLHKSAFLYVTSIFRLSSFVFANALLTGITKTFVPFYSSFPEIFGIYVSPSESELRAIGNTEQKQAEAMKRYIREVFIPEYAKNFNKGLSEVDIKFYGKIHFDRNRSDNELNMHCHLIVSRKDQTNKKKLSPLTNHKNTKNGIIKGGFDRVNLFQQIEQGFGKLFSYNRQNIEAFDYQNTMKNSPIYKQLKLQEQKLEPNERKTEIKQNSNLENNTNTNISTKLETKISITLQNSPISSLLISFTPTRVSSFSNPEELLSNPKKSKRKRRRRIR